MVEDLQGAACCSVIGMSSFTGAEEEILLEVEHFNDNFDGVVVYFVGVEIF